MGEIVTLLYEKDGLVDTVFSSQKALKRNLKKYPGSFVIDFDTLPSFTYREAWRINDGKLSVDMRKAKEIKMERLRTERSLEFIKLDREFIETLSKDQDLTAIKLRQKKLRDITKDVRLKDAKTVDDLDKIKM